MAIVADIVFDSLFFWALLFRGLPKYWKRLLLIESLFYFNFIQPVYDTAVVLKGLYFILTMVLSMMAFLHDLRRRVFYQLRTHVMRFPEI